MLRQTVWDSDFLFTKGKILFIKITDFKISDKNIFREQNSWNDLNFKTGITKKKNQWFQVYQISVYPF